MTILPMISDGNAYVGKVRGVRMLCQVWSNTTQQSGRVDLLVDMAIANNTAALTRFVRKQTKCDWVVTNATPTGDAF